MCTKMLTSLSEVLLSGKWMHCLGDAKKTKIYYEVTGACMFTCYLSQEMHSIYAFQTRSYYFSQENTMASFKISDETTFSHMTYS